MSIINTYDQLKAAGGGIGIIYCPQDLGRGGNCAAWRVIQASPEGELLVTDEEAHWSDRGLKTFSMASPRKEKQARLVEAMQWAEKRYGPRKWVRNKLGDYVDENVNQHYPIAKRERTHVD